MCLSRLSVEPRPRGWGALRCATAAPRLSHGNRFALFEQTPTSSWSAGRSLVLCMAVPTDVASPTFGDELHKHVSKEALNGGFFTLLSIEAYTMRRGLKNVKKEFFGRFVTYEATDDGFSVTDGPLMRINGKSKTMDTYIPVVAVDGGVSCKVDVWFKSRVRSDGYEEHTAQGLKTYVVAMEALPGDLLLLVGDGRQGRDTALQVLFIPQEALDQEARDKLAPFLIGKPPPCERKQRRARAKQASKAAGAAESSTEDRGLSSSVTVYGTLMAKDGIITLVSQDGITVLTVTGGKLTVKDSTIYKDGDPILTVAGELVVEEDGTLYLDGKRAFTVTGEQVIKDSTIHRGHSGAEHAEGAAPGADRSPASNPEANKGGKAAAATKAAAEAIAKVAAKAAAKVITKVAAEAIAKVAAEVTAKAEAEAAAKAAAEAAAKAAAEAAAKAAAEVAAKADSDASAANGSANSSPEAPGPRTVLIFQEAVDVQDCIFYMK